MKKLWMLLLLSILATGAHAQEADEWLRQKKTQRKYLLEQVAALRVYAGYLQQGYAISKEGLQAIGQGKTGEYTSHADYFRSLGQVSPAVSLHWKVAAAISLQEETLRLCLDTWKRVQASDLWGAREAVYVQRVLQGMMLESAYLLEELLAVTTAGSWEMRTGERLRRVEDAYELMLAQHQAVRRFGSETQRLSGIRQLEREAIRRSSILHGLTPGVRR